MGEAIFVVYPAVSKYVYEPGEVIKVSVSVQNTSSVPLFFSKVKLLPSWSPKGQYGIVKPPAMVVQPKKSVCIGDFHLQIPKVAGSVGFHNLQFGLETWQYDCIGNQWLQPVDIWTDRWSVIQVSPKPRYTVFLTRSNRDEDAPLVNYIAHCIKMWGFEVRTVGIDIYAQDPLKVFNVVKEGIANADGTIAVATIRDYDIFEKAFKTFPWFHIETTISTMCNKPLLLIVEDSVKHEGLIGNPHFHQLFFNTSELDVLEEQLRHVMPHFRTLIRDKKWQDYLRQIDKARDIATVEWLFGRQKELCLISPRR